jgi:hypothetical protein
VLLLFVRDGDLTTATAATTAAAATAKQKQAFDDLDSGTGKKGALKYAEFVSSLNALGLEGEDDNLMVYTLLQ